MSQKLPAFSTMPPDMPAPALPGPLANEDSTSTPPHAPDSKQPSGVAGKGEPLAMESGKAGEMEGQASEQRESRLQSRAPLSSRSANTKSLGGRTSGRGSLADVLRLLHLWR